MGQILSIFDVFNDTCRFEDDGNDNGLLMYYHLPSESEKSLERIRFIEKQIEINSKN